MSRPFVFYTVLNFSRSKTAKEKCSTIKCPFCRQRTKLTDGVKNLTTNFYTMPKIEKMIAKRYVYLFNLKFDNHDSFLFV